MISSDYMVTEETSLRKMAATGGLKGKKMAEPSCLHKPVLRHSAAVYFDGDGVARVLASTMHSSIGDRREVFPWQKMAGHAAVGIEELRCTGGAGETATLGRERPEEVVARGPTD
jgi:hypothetical protein